MELQRWRLSVYGPGEPRFRTENTLWWREYTSRTSAIRAVASVRRAHPGSYGELTRFVLRENTPLPIWTCHGNKDVDVFELWDDRG